VTHRCEPQALGRRGMGETRRDRARGPAKKLWATGCDVRLL